MIQYISKDALIAEIERKIRTEQGYSSGDAECGYRDCAREILSFLDTLKVIDPYEQCVQYDSIKAGIQTHAETYSFNIESELFNQLTKEQQKLWRKEIEQACVSGGEAGVELARDPRYKENLEVKEIETPVIPKHSYFEEIYHCGSEPRWKIGDVLAVYEFYSDYEGEYIYGKITDVKMDETEDWCYTFENGDMVYENRLISDETYKKN